LVLAASVSVFVIVGEGFIGGGVDEMLSAARVGRLNKTDEDFDTHTGLMHCSE